MFFEHADSLVGVCKDVQSLSSQVLTLQLSQYDANDADEDDAPGDGDALQRGSAMQSPADSGSRSRGEPASRSSIDSSRSNNSDVGLSKQYTALGRRRNDKGLSPAAASSAAGTAAAGAAVKGTGASRRMLQEAIIEEGDDEEGDEVKD